MECLIIMFTDGSGGGYSHEPRLRLCGWSWIVNRTPTMSGPLLPTIGNIGSWMHTGQNSLHV
eukprot:146550-Karenia_brevis.AAC.1